MSIAYDIVKKHGGEIEVVSEVGKGTTFTVALPSKANKMDRTAKVLFLDDERNVLKSLKRTFVDDDLDILTCTNGAEALEIVKNNKVSVIVSDNLMPGMNGVEFLHQAKHASPIA